MVAPLTHKALRDQMQAKYQDALITAVNSALIRSNRLRDITITVDDLLFGVPEHDAEALATMADYYLTTLYRSWDITETGTDTDLTWVFNPRSTDPR